MTSEELRNRLTPLLTDENRIRESDLASIYRVRAEINGIDGDYEVTHIHLPLQGDKALLLKIKREMSGKDEDPDEEIFLRQIRNADRRYIQIEKIAEKNGKTEKMLCRAVAKRVGLTMKREEKTGEFDFYQVSEVPSGSSVSVSEGLLTGEGSKKEILRLALILISTAVINERFGLHLGSVNPERLSFQKTDEKIELKNDNLYCLISNQDEERAFSLLDCPHIHPKLYDGTSAPSILTDTYAVSSLLWSLLSGEHYSTAPDLSENPSHASENLSLILRMHLQDEVPVEQCARSLSSAIRSELELPEEKIVFAPAKYEERYKQLKEEEERNAVQDNIAPVEKSRWKRFISSLKKPRRRRYVLFIALCSLLIALFSHFFRSQLSNDGPEEESSVEDISVEESMEEESSIEESIEESEEDAPPIEGVYSSSREAGLYRQDGYIVTEDRERSGLYFLDENGSICWAPSLQPRSIEALILREGVIDLRGEEIIFDRRSDTLEIGKRLVEKYSIEIGSVLYVSSTHLSLDDAFSGCPIVSGLKTRGNKVILHLEGRAWGEVFQNADSDLYEKLELISREDETMRLTARVTDSGGIRTILYYDEDGHVHSEEEYRAQEKLKTAINQAKYELQERWNITGNQVLVAADDVLDFIPIDEICFEKETYKVTLSQRKSGGYEPALFVIRLNVYPENATNKEVVLNLDGAETGKANAVSMPYSYNAPLCTEAYSGNALLNRATVDLSGDENTLVIQGEAIGVFSLKARAKTSEASMSVRIELTNEQGFTEEMVKEISKEESSQQNSSLVESSREEFPEESSASEESHQESCTEESREEYSSEESIPQWTPPPVTNSSISPPPPPAESSVYTPPPTPPETSSKEESKPPMEEESSSLPPQWEEEPFEIGPASIELKVGETYNLTPSKSCMWSISAPQVATIESPRTVVAVSPGICVVTGTCAGSGEKASITITVVE